MARDILHTRALKVESINAESEERQKFCVKEDGQEIMLGTDYGSLGFQMSLDFFL